MVHIKCFEEIVDWLHTLFTKIKDEFQINMSHIHSFLACECMTLYGMSWDAKDHMLLPYSAFWVKFYDPLPTCPLQYGGRNLFMWNA